MDKKVVKNENLEVVITVKASGDDWKKQVNKEFNKKAANVTVPGFRKGKAPANMVKSRINQAEVYNEAMFFFADAAYKEAVTENKFQVFTQPKVNEVKKLDAEGVEFTITFGLPPVIELGAYTNLGIEAKEVKVSAKEVTSFVDDLVKQHALMQVKEGAAKLGDTVIIDFTGYIDGVAFDGGEAKGYELELGSNSFIPGFEDQLVGIKAGEDKEITVTFPENYVESLKGKTANFKVKCGDVKEKVLPALDEEFFKELAIEGVTDEKTLKDYAKAQVTSRKVNEAKQAQLNEIVDKAVDNAKVILPPDMIEQEANAMLENVKKQVEQAGLTYKDYVAINGMKEEELVAQRRKDAEKNLKSMLVIEKIIIDEKLDVTAEDLKNEFARIADMYKMKVEDVEKALGANKEAFVNQLRNRKFTEFMASKNVAGAATAEKKAPAKKATTTKKAAATGEKKTTTKKTTTAKSTTAKKTTKKTTKAAE